MGGTASPGFEFISQLGSFCAFVSRTQAQTLGLNQTVIYLQHQVSYIQSEGKGQGLQASTGRNLKGAPLLPSSALTRHTAKHSYSGIREEGYRMGPGNLCTNKQRMNRTRKPLRKNMRDDVSQGYTNVCLNNGPATRRSEPPP